MKSFLRQMRSWSHEFRPSAGLRQFLVAILYAALLSACLPSAYLLRFDFRLSSGETVNLLRCLLWVVPLKVLLLFQLGTLRSHLGIFGVVGFVRVAAGLAMAAVVLLAVRLVSQATVFAPPPRPTPVAPQGQNRLQPPKDGMDRGAGEWSALSCGVVAPSVLSIRG